MGPELGEKVPGSFGNQWDMTIPGGYHTGRHAPRLAAASRRTVQRVIARRPFAARLRLA
jgi:hypothetical protein